MCCLVSHQGSNLCPVPFPRWGQLSILCLSSLLRRAVGHTYITIADRAPIWIQRCKWLAAFPSPPTRIGWVEEHDISLLVLMSPIDRGSVSCLRGYAANFCSLCSAAYCAPMHGMETKESSQLPCGEPSDPSEACRRHQATCLAGYTNFRSSRPSKHGTTVGRIRTRAPT
ncbi:hypothetical protein B0T25DRAFT_198149 [Lasiosphaeria hispida]|uniref:Uncharacterized protein n=1 Tax=Lasiosphaeria hispida TaxID=260671 RepID=A0AAJ0HIA8_9PEZI|nr:hypothetical protein B0T25DRAFT_198149 [Lasiosphaeria hispida]